MEFADKAKFGRDAVRLWNYIEGYRNKEPTVPDLVEGKTIKGKDAAREEHTITTDAAEVAKAKKDAEPWWKGTKKVLTLIVDASQCRLDSRRCRVGSLIMRDGISSSLVLKPCKLFLGVKRIHHHNFDILIVCVVGTHKLVTEELLTDGLSYFLTSKFGLVTQKA
jgi:hypothetical protein